MQHEFQNAYLVSQRTTNYDPDAKDIQSIQNMGYFVVVRETPAYCRHTDAMLPNPMRHLAREADRRAMAFQTAEAAHGRIRALHEAEDGGEIRYTVRGPNMAAKYWKGCVVAFVADMVKLDPEDARSWCGRNSDRLMAMHARQLPPAVAAAEFCKGQDRFDHAAWQRANLPEPPAADEQPAPGIAF